MNYRTFRLYFAFRLVLFALVFSVAVPVFGQATEIYNGIPAVREEILVRLRSSDSATMARAQNAAPFGSIRTLSPALGLHLVRAPGNSIAGLMRAFSNHPDVLYAEPNYIVQAVTTNPNDSFFSSLWGMQKIEAPIAWDTSTGGTSVVIGVVDSGIDYTHPDLAESIWSAPTAFSVTIQGFTVNCPAGSHGFNALNFSCDPGDDNNHGTHVSGTIGATGNNSLGVVGVNWRARIMGLKFLNANGMGPVSAAINAIEFAIQVKARFAGSATPVDVRVLSNSWSGSGFSQSLLAEINKANANDILFVAAAGNSSANNDQTPSYPANFSTTAPNVISVAATDSSDSLAEFSSYGASTVQLGAPGVGIYSTVRNGQYASFSGTSMATPHVAGAALLAVSACPSLNTAALKNAILANVDPVPSLAGTTVTGGRLNINRTIRSCIPPSAGTLKATFLGTDRDYVGPTQIAPSGTPDWRLLLEGLRSSPVKIRISSSSGGVWESPFNGSNWLILLQYDGGGNANLWFEPWSVPGFHVKVWYSDGSSDEVDAIVAAPPSAFKASFLGVTGEDYVGPGQIAPSGTADWRMQLEGLRSSPVKIRISSSSGGVWESPFNGSNWLILPQYDGGGNANLWFEPWSVPGFHVKVWYSDGSSDEVDAIVAAPPSAFKASFLGVTGEDYVGPWQIAPSGTADWRMQLEGLRGNPVKIRIWSSSGVWESPFNGVNWLIFSQYDGGGNANLWFEPWSVPGFHVMVWYSDGTTDEADAS